MTEATMVVDRGSWLIFANDFYALLDLQAMEAKKDK